MDLYKLIEFNNELTKNGYKLTNWGVRKKTDTTCPYTSIYLDDTCIEHSKIIDEKIKEGVWKIDERKNPKKNLMGCYEFKHLLEKINDGKYVTMGQMISIMVMKGLLRKGTKDIILLKYKLLVKSLLDLQYQDK